MAETKVVTSVLYKVLRLTTGSSYFPSLVQAAAALENKPYSQELLVWVASRPEVTNALVVRIVDGSPEPLDAVLENLLVTHGTTVDTVIRNSVKSFSGTGGA